MKIKLLVFFIYILINIHFINSFHKYISCFISGQLRRVYITLYKDKYRNKLIYNNIRKNEKQINKIVSANVLSYKKFVALWWYMLKNHWKKVNGIFCVFISFHM